MNVLKIMIASLLTVSLTAPVVVQASKITNDATSIYYTGHVDKGDRDKLKKVLDSTGIKVVNLNSRGGFAWEALRIGYLFKDYGITVVIDDDNHCLSACATLTVGAKHKQIKGLLGFHVAWSKDKGTYSEGLTRGQFLGAIKAIYYFDMGYIAHLPYLITRYTKPDTFLLLSQEDLEKFKYDSKENYGSSFPTPDSWIADRMAGAMRLRLLLKNN